MKSPIVLAILDGFGYSADYAYNAIAQAEAPHLHEWMRNAPCRLLAASGHAVGLPDGIMGNSEVGHLTIGCGRIVDQPLTIINHAIDDGSFFSHERLIKTLKSLPPEKTLHIMGLLSDGNVHSSIKHLYAFITIAKNLGVKRLVIHPFLDGRDTLPRSAEKYLAQLHAFIKNNGYIIGSIQGRSYAMDRNDNWHLIEKSYAMLTTKSPIKFSSWQSALIDYYRQGITDEFIPPTLLDQTATIKDGDGIIFFNIRPDRSRELCQAFLADHFNHFNRTKSPLAFFITPVWYGGQNLATTILFDYPPLSPTIKEILSAHQKTIFTIAESEKYAHVTYFFDGLREKKFATETRTVLPSLHTRKFDQQPAMQAPEITQKIIDSLRHDPHDFYLINYANADMVAHSGNFAATITAIEWLDKELARLYQAVIQENGVLLITADHGNAEDMYDPSSRQPKTAHTTNPVPFIVLTNNQIDLSLLQSMNQLADIAPFILHLLQLPIPAAMKHHK